MHHHLHRVAGCPSQQIDCLLRPGTSGIPILKIEATKITYRVHFPSLNLHHFAGCPGNKVISLG